jgi:hypothetical protein
MPRGIPLTDTTQNQSIDNLIGVTDSSEQTTGHMYILNQQN